MGKQQMNPLISKGKIQTMIIIIIYRAEFSFWPTVLLTKEQWIVLVCTGSVVIQLEED